ncbi:MAG: ABC transporter ATP-binding protein [Armatimonadetes bacterium]|nr:ABC transporter ATP-binding protein [Armatimonadota bacterium]
MIELHNASRWYGQVIGLNDVSTTIGPGVTAMLGQNGAGKTTLMRLITGQLRPTTGDVKVLGMDPFANVEVFKRLGYCPDIDNFPEHLSGREFVFRMARLMGIATPEAKRRTEETLTEVGMVDRAHKPLLGYSKGMRQRIKLAQAMLHDPDILLLDEPLNGLDPVGRRELMVVLGDLAARGKSVLVSSHILFEVEQMTRSILVLHRGRLLASGDLQVIRDLIDRHPHRIKLSTASPRRLASRLADVAAVLSLEIDEAGGMVEIQTRQPDVFYDALPDLVLQEGIDLYGFESPDNNLDSVFRYLVDV